MAILMNDNDFKCSCGCIQFKKEVIKSFTVGKQIEGLTPLYEETSRDVLECVQCGTKYDVKEQKLLLKEID